MSDPSAVNTVLDSCCLCGFVFVDKKRKRSITGEFAEIFANVCKEKNKDGLPRAVCGTCKYRVEKAWKNGSVGATERLLKRKHPVSPLSSSQDDEQTVRRIERKKAGHRLVFDDSKATILPKETELSVSSAPQIKSTREAGSQTVKSSCHCWESSVQGTCVKVCTISELQLSVNKCKLHLSTDKTVHSYYMFV